MCLKPLLKTLHWLPVKNCIDHKMFSLAYNCFSGTVPQYLQELIPCYLEPQSLRASSQSRLRILNVVEGHTQKQFGFRALFNQPPDWNALLKMLRESESSSAFCRKLKTHLFSNQWLHNHPPLPSFSLFVFSVVYHLAPVHVCTMSIALPGTFEHSTNWQS